MHLGVGFRIQISEWEEGRQSYQSSMVSGDVSIPAQTAAFNQQSDPVVWRLHIHTQTQKPHGHLGRSPAGVHVRHARQGAHALLREWGTTTETDRYLSARSWRIYNPRGLKTVRKKQKQISVPKAAWVAE